MHLHDKIIEVLSIVGNISGQQLIAGRICAGDHHRDPLPSAANPLLLGGCLHPQHGRLPGCDEQHLKQKRNSISIVTQPTAMYMAGYPILVNHSKY